MKHFFSLICVLALFGALVACGSKKEEKPEYEEQVTKEVPAEEGGKVESSDGSTSIEIPGGALDEDTKITMRIYDAQGYVGTEGQHVLSKVVEFEPSGLIFKKPVVITMINNENTEGKVITAAVYRESKGEWSYNEHGAYAVVAGKDEAGDPIMQSAAGDPIMLNAAGDPIMTNAAGDPIMMAAAGDPIMLAAAGDPIMTNAAGDPIMNAAAGDPIMMTTGHFTAYTFIALGSDKPVEEPDGDDVEISDKDIIDEPVVKDDDEENDDDEEDDDEISDMEEDDDEPVSDEDETPVDEDTDTYVAECGNGIVDPGEACDKGTDNGKTDCDYGQESCTVCTTACQVAEGITSFCGDGIVQSNEKCDKAETGAGIGSICSDNCRQIYSKVLCTGQTVCTSGNRIAECPKEGEELYGQDAQYLARRSCVPKRFTKKEIPYTENEEELVAKIIEDENTHLMWIADKTKLPSSAPYESAKDFCESLSYGGYEDWRLPNPKEFVTITDNDSFEPSIKRFYFSGVLMDGYRYWTNTVFTSSDGESTEERAFTYNFSDGDMSSYVTTYEYGKTICVRGEEYGSTGTFTTGADTVWDSDTNLMWQKTYVSGKSWKGALSYCENLEYAGYSDWRLPNRNELLSLVDYSKSEPASSFPGMTAEEYWASTFRTYYGGQSGVFIVNMKKGEVDTDWHSANSDSSAYAVRCVRSDLKPKLPETEVYPCDATGHGPCRDEANNIVWSSRLINDVVESGQFSWREIAEFCRSRGEAASDKWRLPTIDEIRKTIPEGNLKEGGSCNVTDENPTSEYYSQETCSGAAVTETTLYDYGYMASSTVNSDTGDSWAVNLKTGNLTAFSMYDADAWNFIERCVLDTSLDFEKAPYFDSETNLHWSKISSKIRWYEAAKYCEELVEDGSNNWRVPTEQELLTLARGCGLNDSCKDEASGRYSVFGDIVTLWTSETNNGYDPLVVLDFLSVTHLDITDLDNARARVRCVRSEEESENVDDFEFPFEPGDLMWSKVSENAMDLEDAVEYCNGLNTEGYGGRTDWRVPDSGEVASLIRMSACPNKNDLVTGNTNLCSKYSFNGYSVFGDMFNMIASNGYTFNFARGYMSQYSGGWGRVRCVVSLPDAAQ